MGGGVHPRNHRNTTPRRRHVAATVGTLSLTGGSISTDNTYVGYDGNGTFNQTGGSHTTSGFLSLGEVAGSSRTYVLGGTGQLTTPYSAVGYNGTGTFTQTGGTNTSAGRLTVGGTAGVADFVNNGVLTLTAGARSATADRAWFSAGAAGRTSARPTAPAGPSTSAEKHWK